MSVDSLARYVGGCVNKARQQAAKEGIHRGRVSGNCVLIDGRLFPYTAEVDVPLSDGDVVFVTFCDDGVGVSVVGK